MATLEEEILQSRKAADEITGEEYVPKSTAEYIAMQRESARKAAHLRSTKMTHQVVPVIGKNKTTGETEYGDSCLYTATDNYGDERYRQASNRVFANKPEKYGFKRIKVADAMPGDIIQRGGYDDMTGQYSPGHGMVFDGYDKDGQPLFNYSRGGNDPNGPSDIRLHHPFQHEPMDDYFYRAYRFVGTPEDEIRWAQEYRAKYPAQKIQATPLDAQGQGHYKIEKR